MSDPDTPIISDVSALKQRLLQDREEQVTVSVCAWLRSCLVQQRRLDLPGIGLLEVVNVKGESEDHLEVRFRPRDTLVRRLRESSNSSQD